jgi:RimJ/RimL family protein N-acetyltransferase
LSQEALLMSIAKWRNKFMRFYLSQSETDLKSTTEYIQSKINHDSSAIFFMITDEHYKIIGHIGFSNIEEVSAELDNILLGENTAIKGLMKDVEMQSIDWIRNFLNVEKIFLRVLSYNFLAINLHQECGFSIEQLVPIKRIQHPNKFTYEPCEQDETDLEFHCLVMSKYLKDAPIV